MRAQLLDFLKTLRPRRDRTGRDLKQTLAAKLEKFYSTEGQLSRQDSDRLTKPGGPEDADLGVIFHLQTKQGTIGKFWDQESATIALLQEKGLSGDFTFGYDWHWRAEFSYKGRRNCPFSILHQTYSHCFQPAIIHSRINCPLKRPTIAFDISYIGPLASKFRKSGAIFS